MEDFVASILRLDEERNDTEIMRLVQQSVHEKAAEVAAIAWKMLLARRWHIARVMADSLLECRIPFPLLYLTRSIVEIFSAHPDEKLKEIGVLAEMVNQFDSNKINIIHDGAKPLLMAIAKEQLSPVQWSLFLQIVTAIVPALRVTVHTPHADRGCSGSREATGGNGSSCGRYWRWQSRRCFPSSPCSDHLGKVVPDFYAA